MTFQRFWFHLYAVAWCGWRHVPVAFHDYMTNKMFMKMIYVFNNAVFQRGAHRNEIKEGYVLNVFAQTDSSGVRANGNAKLSCYQQDCKHFIYAAEAAAIDL